MLEGLWKAGLGGFVGLSSVWALRSCGTLGRARLCSKGSSARAEPLRQNQTLGTNSPRCPGLVSSSLVLLLLFWDLFSLSCCTGRAGSQEKAPVVCWVIQGFIHIPYPAFMVLLLLFP